jgi:hypothetical protein
MRENPEVQGKGEAVQNDAAEGKKRYGTSRGKPFS